jgi:hypothetical protein
LFFFFYFFFFLLDFMAPSVMQQHWQRASGPSDRMDRNSTLRKGEKNRRGAGGVKEKLKQ